MNSQELTKDVRALFQRYVDLRGEAIAVAEKLQAKAVKARERNLARKVAAWIAIARSWDRHFVSPGHLAKLTEEGLLLERLHEFLGDPYLLREVGRLQSAYSAVASAAGACIRAWPTSGGS